MSAKQNAMENTARPTAATKLRWESELSWSAQALPLTRIQAMEALKARRSTAQGGAKRNPEISVACSDKLCKGGTVCFALAGLNFLRFNTQGCGCFSALPWAVLSRAFSASHA
jgi:hypothetical protein